jgi:hypothetical protein
MGRLPARAQRHQHYRKASVRRSRERARIADNNALLEHEPRLAHDFGANVYGDSQ